MPVAAVRTDSAEGYAPPDQDRPVAAYAGLTGTFAVAFGGALVALRASGRELPERPSAGDVVLGGFATHKLSRMLAKDKVTSFVRAPFTRYREPAGHGELDEAPRGDGLRYAVGELLVCPYCLAQWIAATYAVGLVAAPRLTRFVAGIYAMETVADFLQLAYKGAENQT